MLPDHATTPCPVESGISDADFHRVAELVRQRVGIVLSGDKRTLVVGRLKGLVRDRGFDSLAAWAAATLDDPSPNDISELVDRIATNYTFFNRESPHFDFLTGVALPALVKQHDVAAEKDIRVWCAAASTGEEPYTIAMHLMRFLGDDYPNYRAGVLATDVSIRALEVARLGTYPMDSAQALGESLYREFFRECGTEQVEVVAELKREVVYRRFNITNRTFPFRHRFHIVFCRNLMIYFDAEERRELIDRLYDQIEPGGYLFVGMSESLDRTHCPFRFIEPAVYRKDD